MKLTTPLIITLAASFLTLVGFAVYLISTGHDPGQYVGTVTTLVTLIPVAIGLSVAQGKTDKKVDTIQTQTNGTLTKLHDAVAAKEAENQALRSLLTPDQIAQVAPVVPIIPTIPAAPIADPITTANDGNV